MSTACSSTEDADPADTPELDGVYLADDGHGAGIDEIELRDFGHRLLADGCENADCEEHGAFAVDHERGELRLTADTGKVQTLPIEVVAADAAAPAGEVGADEAEVDPTAGTELRPLQLVQRQKL